MPEQFRILATSVSRRKLSDESLEEYVNAAKELGKELNIPVLDVYKRTNDWINEVGLEEAKSLYKNYKSLMMRGLCITLSS